MHKYSRGWSDIAATSDHDPRRLASSARKHLERARNSVSHAPRSTASICPLMHAPYVPTSVEQLANDAANRLTYRLLRSASAGGRIVSGDQASAASAAKWHRAQNRN